MLQQDQAVDYVLATGVTTTVRDFVRMAFQQVGVELTFSGEGEQEVAVVKACHNPDYVLPVGKQVVAVDPRYFRPAEVELLIGSPQKAKDELGWEPQYDLAALCKEMVEADLDLFKQDQLLQNAGFAVRNEFE